MDIRLVNIGKDEIPKLLLKSSTLKGVKGINGYVYLFYINGVDDITISIWSKNCNDLITSKRGSILELEKLIWDCLEFDEYLNILKDAIPID